MDASSPQNPSAVRALVVDDSTTVRRLMELTLGKLHHVELDFTDNGEDAIARAMRNHYDIIFLDIMLPGIDGYRVCRAIKADKRTKNVPVIMLTSKGTAIDKVRGIMAGSSVYLTKPLERHELLQAMEKCLPAKRGAFLPGATGGMLQPRRAGA